MNTSWDPSGRQHSKCASLAQSLCGVPVNLPCLLPASVLSLLSGAIARCVWHLQAYVCYRGCDSLLLISHVALETLPNRYARRYTTRASASPQVDDVLTELGPIPMFPATMFVGKGVRSYHPTHATFCKEAFAYSSLRPAVTYLSKTTRVYSL